MLYNYVPLHTRLASCSLYPAAYLQDTSHTTMVQLAVRAGDPSAGAGGFRGLCFFRVIQHFKGDAARARFSLPVFSRLLRAQTHSAHCHYAYAR